VNILLVDDDADYNDVLCETLSLRGHNVLSATNGGEAYDLLQHSQVDLVISDVQMPICCGAQLHELVRSDERFRALPFIFMTGFPILRAATPLADRKIDFMVNKVQFSRLIGIINDIHRN
jgi:two-component system, NtrC family, response regulator HydG